MVPQKVLFLVVLLIQPSEMHEAGRVDSGIFVFLFLFSKLTYYFFTVMAEFFQIKGLSNLTLPALMPDEEKKLM